MCVCMCMSVRVCVCVCVNTRGGDGKQFVHVSPSLNGLMGNFVKQERCFTFRCIFNRAECV